MTAVDIEYDLGPAPPAVQGRSLPAWIRLWRHPALRRALVLFAFALAWEIAARWADNDLMLPTFGQTLRAFVDGVVSGELLVKAGISLSVLLKGYALGVACAFALTCLAISFRWGRDILATLTAMLNPLPPVALLPLSLLWFGLGQGSLVFVLVHSVVWPLTLSTVTGFEAVPETLRMAGRNYGLRGLRYVFQILVPAALPSIVSGLKIGWAFAWRTLIAAELVFGASSGKGGLGWYIFQNRNELQTDRVFAGLGMVIVIGLLVEVAVFRTLERLTVQRWGMQRST
jgi:NitT/TauT family transport system permease protein